MVSRKKEKQQARNIKRECKIANGISAVCVCDHYGQERNWSNDDVNTVHNLGNEFYSSFHPVVDPFGDPFDNPLPFGVNQIYFKYHQLSNIQKELFRLAILSTGTKICLDKAYQVDLKTVSHIEGVAPWVLMFLTIEVRDRNNGAYNLGIRRDIRTIFDDAFSPREAVRFFHRRNSCDCLKELYYHLKETTIRTSFCWQCYKIVNIRELFRCECCNVEQFCSHECAATWEARRKHDHRELNNSESSNEDIEVKE